MKSLSLFFCLLVTFFFISCEQEIPTLEAPPPAEGACNSCPTDATSGSASFDKFVTLGNSFVAGFQSGALFDQAQQNSLANIISKQLACAEGDEVFNQPDINSFNGFNTQLSVPSQGVILGRLILFDDGSGPVPTPAGAPGLPPPYNTADLPTVFTGDKSSLNNFGVPLIFLGQALIPDTGNPSSPFYNPLWARFASNPGVKSIAEDALAAAGSFYLIWLGADDALLHAALGADGSFPLTPVSAFSAQYSALISTMLTVNPDFKGVVGNIPSIVTYPYFTTVAYNSVPLDGLAAAFIQSSFGDKYNSFINAMAGLGNISEEERSRRILAYVEGNNPVLISDEALTDLTNLMIENGASDLVPFAQARQASANDLIPLAAGGVIGTPYMNNPAAIQGVTWPLDDQYALTIDEIVEIETHIAGYNIAIENAVSLDSDRLVVADVNSALQILLGASISSGGLLLDGVSITSNISPPTAAYSEDGLHPNSRGYAYIGNVFINAINTKFGASVPNICINEYRATSLPINSQ